MAKVGIILLDWLALGLEYDWLALDSQQKHNIREKMVEALEKQFPEMGLKYSIGK